MYWTSKHGLISLISSNATDKQSSFTPCVHLSTSQRTAPTLRTHSKSLLASATRSKGMDCGECFMLAETSRLWCRWWRLFSLEYWFKHHVCGVTSEWMLTDTSRLWCRFWRLFNLEQMHVCMCFCSRFLSSGAAILRYSLSPVSIDMNSEVHAVTNTSGSVDAHHAVTNTTSWWPKEGWTSIFKLFRLL